MMETFSTREIIEHGLESVAAALNQRPPSPATVDAWADLFTGENPRLLAACFRRLAEESEKFPPPRRMRSMLAEYKPSGNPPLTHTGGFDVEGQPCWLWSDAPTVPAYLAANCSEGLECRAKLRRLCGTKKPAGAKEEKARRAELQSQKSKFSEGRKNCESPERMVDTELSMVP
jgi:hypothetical protein